MDPRWYETFFQGLALEFWRAAMTADQTRREADFLVRALGPGRGARVLDVPCGLGRHALELASRGCRVTGVDLSEEAIASCRQDAARRNLEVDWHRKDMRDLPWTEEFDAAYCFGNSFGYLEPAGSRAFLRSVARALKPGARFVLDSGLLAESALPHLCEREWARVGDILFLEEHRYHAAESCIETTYTFTRGGATSTAAALHWVHTLREVREMMQEAGLNVPAVHGSLEETPFQAGDRYAILVAQKMPAPE